MALHGAVEQRAERPEVGGGPDGRRQLPVPVHRAGLFGGPPLGDRADHGHARVPCPLGVEPGPRGRLRGCCRGRGRAAEYRASRGLGLVVALRQGQLRGQGGRGRHVGTAPRRRRGRYGPRLSLGPRVELRPRTGRGLRLGLRPRPGLVRRLGPGVRLGPGFGFGFGLRQGRAARGRAVPGTGGPGSGTPAPGGPGLRPAPVRVRVALGEGRSPGPALGRGRGPRLDRGSGPGLGLGLALLGDPGGGGPRARPVRGDDPGARGGLEVGGLLLRPAGGDVVGVPRPGVVPGGHEGAYPGASSASGARGGGRGGDCAGAAGGGTGSGADGTGAGNGAGAGPAPQRSSGPESVVRGTGSYPHRASSAAPAARPVSTTRPSSHTNTVRTVMFRWVQPCACSTRSAVSTSDATSAAL